MSLNTVIDIMDPIDPYKVLSYANEELFKVDGVEYTECHLDINPEGVITLYNLLGQGLPTGFTLDYRHDDYLYEENQYDDFDEDEEPMLVGRPCYISLSLDTPYSYGDENGDCNTLHAMYIVKLHEWLNEQGVRMNWVNGYTLEVNAGVEGLEEMFAHGDKKIQRFEESIMPCLMEQLTRKI